MAVCEGCGKDHEAVIQENLPEYVMLNKIYKDFAERANNSESHEDVIPQMVTAFFKVYSQSEVDNIMQFFMEKTGNVRNATIYGFLTVAETAFAMGVLAAKHYTEHFPQHYEFATEEEVAAYQQEEEEIKAAAADSDVAVREAISAVIEKLGLDPEKFDVDELMEKYKDGSPLMIPVPASSVTNGETANNEGEDGASASGFGLYL